MRNDIKFETISADVVEKKGAARSAAMAMPVTIAFTLAYDGKNPQVVQQVANVLASLYLEENLKTRERQSAGASRFLEEEALGMQRNLADLDAKIAVFKARNINAVPELLQVNYQGLDRTERDLDQLKDQLKASKEKERYLRDTVSEHPYRKHRPGQEPPQRPEGKARPARKPLLRQVSRREENQDGYSGAGKEDRPPAPRRRQGGANESPYLGSRSTEQPFVRRPRLPTLRRSVGYRIGKKADRRPAKEA